MPPRSAERGTSRAEQPPSPSICSRKGNPHGNLIQRTIDLANANVERGGRPFASSSPRGARSSPRRSTSSLRRANPTAHAEICARCGRRRRSAAPSSSIRSSSLAHPCPMCLAAMYYCSPDRVVFITTRDDYSRYCVDDRKSSAALQLLRSDRHTVAAARHADGPRAQPARHRGLPALEGVERLTSTIMPSASVSSRK